MENFDRRNGFERHFCFECIQPPRITLRGRVRLSIRFFSPSSWLPLPEDALLAAWPCIDYRNTLKHSICFQLREPAIYWKKLVAYNLRMTPCCRILFFAPLNTSLFLIVSFWHVESFASFDSNIDIISYRPQFVNVQNKRGKKNNKISKNVCWKNTNAGSKPFAGMEK